MSLFVLCGVGVTGRRRGGPRGPSPPDPGCKRWVRCRSPRSRRPGWCYCQELFTQPRARAALKALTCGREPALARGTRRGALRPSACRTGTRAASLAGAARPGFSLVSVTRPSGAHQWEAGGCAGATSRPWGRGGGLREPPAPGATPAARADSVGVVVSARAARAGSRGPAQLLPHCLSSVLG